MRACSPPFFATLQVQICPLIQEWIIAGIHARNSGDGIEDDLALLFVVVVRDLIQGNGTQFHELSIFRPPLRRVVGNVTFLGDLGPPAEADAAVNDTCLDLIVKIRGILALGLLVSDVRLTRVWGDAVADEGFLSVRGDQLESVDAEVFLSPEAAGEWLWSSDKCSRSWVLAEESFDGRWILRCVGRGRSAKRL